MKDPAAHLTLLFEKSEQYAHTTFDLYKLKLAAKSADIISVLVSRLAVGIILSLVFILLNLGVALWAGELLGKTYYGFFALAALNSVFGLTLYLFRNKWIITPVKNAIANITLK